MFYDVFQYRHFQYSSIGNLINVTTLIQVIVEVEFKKREEILGFDVDNSSEFKINFSCLWKI